MTPTIQLNDEELCRPSLYPEGTLVIKTWGPGAARASHLGIQRHLGALTGTAPSALQVWRAEDPYRWYVVGPPSLHGKTGQLRDPMFFFPHRGAVERDGESPRALAAPNTKIQRAAENRKRSDRRRVLRKGAKQSGSGSGVRAAREGKGKSPTMWK